jgi:hypothetical protein
MKQSPLLISKTTFQDYEYCPRNVWIKLHKPELAKHFTLSEYEKHLMEQGNEVDSYARNLFPGGIEVVAYGDDACEETVRFMTSGVPALFQSTFIVDDFIARNDALVYNNKDKCWDLYEVKATNSVKDSGPERNHITDLAFQASILKRAGINVGKYYLVHLDKNYIRIGDLEVNSLFEIEDKTEEVLNKLPQIEEHMEIAKDYLNKKEEPTEGCECVYRGRSRHCTTFKYSNPHVPDYSVHDISRIGLSKKKLEALVEKKIFDLNEVPDDTELSDGQWNQIRSHRSNITIVNREGVEEELSKLKFPLYFLDYETFAPAIPIFTGYSPYQRIPFQFSLHILEDPESELKHVEYLHEYRSDPSETVIKLLEQNIGNKGTVIAWKKSFEKSVNKELGLRNPDCRDFMERLDGMFYDLQDVFTKQHYVHPEFKGKTSIKKVLPAIVPDLQYKNLDINNGAQASDSWWTMVSPATPKEESEKIARDLKIYCGFDTYAMYAIWKALI